MVQRLYLILQLVDLVAACYERKVLRFDTALHNGLLADDYTITIMDFANKTAETLDADLSAANFDDYTAKMEVLHVVNAIYSISR